MKGERRMGDDDLMGYDAVDLEFRIFISLCVGWKGGWMKETRGMNRQDTSRTLQDSRERTKSINTEWKC